MIRTALIFMLLLVICRTGSGQIVTPRPDEVTDVGIVDRRGSALPLNTQFVDSRGNSVRLADYFDSRRPVILSFNYATCPMLCRLQLNGLVEGLRELNWTAGDEFRVVSVSIDPSETSQQAAAAKQQHLNAYGRPGSGAGWTFLTGQPANIRAAAAAAGFKYKYLPKTREYSHAAALMICTPDGRVSQYLYGVSYDRQTLRLALADASEGQVGSALDQLLLFCFRYDRTAGKYTPVAWNIMRAAGLVTLLTLTAGLAPFWFRPIRQRTAAAPSDLKKVSDPSSADQRTECPS